MKTALNVLERELPKRKYCQSGLGARALTGGTGHCRGGSALLPQGCLGLCTVHVWASGWCTEAEEHSEVESSSGRKGKIPFLFQWIGW